VVAISWGCSIIKLSKGKTNKNPKEKIKKGLTSRKPYDIIKIQKEETVTSLSK